MDLDNRAYCIDSFGNRYVCNSTWSNWARWVVLAVIIFAFFLLLFLLGCVNARRRRNRGRTPYYGTGWMPNGRSGVGGPPPQQYGYNQPPPPPGQNNQGYYAHYSQPNAAAPPYSPGPNGGFRDEQTSGIELQQPVGSHQPPKTEYEPPPGPPPGKY